MKRKLFIGLMGLLIIGMTSLTYGEKERDGREFGGPMMMDGAGPGMEPGMPMQHGEFMDGRISNFFIPEVQIILENYRIKVQKVFLDAKQLKIELNMKRHELVEKIAGLARKYKTDKTAGKDLVGATRELNTIQDQIMDINQDAMKKIAALNQDREREVKAARDTWLKKIDTDDNELAKYADWINKKAEKHYGKKFRGPCDQQGDKPGDKPADK
jgi:hypothetical protein